MLTGPKRSWSLNIRKLDYYNFLLLVAILHCGIFIKFSEFKFFEVSQINPIKIQSIRTVGVKNGKKKDAFSLNDLGKGLNSKKVRPQKQMSKSLSLSDLNGSAKSIQSKRKN